MQRVLILSRHPAVGVRHHEHAGHTQQVAGEHQRTQHVVGDARSGVADDLRVAGGHPDDAQRVDAGVEAGDDCEAPVRIAVHLLLGER